MPSGQWPNPWSRYVPEDRSGGLVRHGPTYTLLETSEERAVVAQERQAMAEQSTITAPDKCAGHYYAAVEPPAGYHWEIRPDCSRVAVPNTAPVIVTPVPKIPVTGTAPAINTDYLADLSKPIFKLGSFDVTAWHLIFAGVGLWVLSKG
jgi:hypothetical protein